MTKSEQSRKEAVLRFANKAVGIPFLKKGRSFSGWDCYGMVVVGYDEGLNVILPSFVDHYDDVKSTETLANIIDFNKKEMKCWREVFIPIPWDVVTLRLGGNVTHLGLMISPIEFLNVEVGTYTTKDSIRSLLWRNRIDGFWRYELF